MGQTAAFSEMGSSGEWPELSANVAFDLGERSRPVPIPDLLGPAIYLDLFAGTLDFAALSHLSLHPRPTAARRNGDEQAWEWIQVQAREGVSNSEWYREDLMTKVCVIFGQLFLTLGQPFLFLAKKLEAKRSLPIVRKGGVSGQNLTGDEN